MPPIVDVADPAVRLSTLVEQARRGEDIVISCDGVPSARIIPVRPSLNHTIQMILEERAKRCTSTAAENRAARDTGRR